MTAIGDDTYSKDMRFKVGLRYLFAEIVIAPQADQPRYAMCSVRDGDGSMSGGGCFAWPEAKH